MSLSLRIVCCCIIGCLLTTSCNKDELEPKDFRDRYVGQYKVVETNNCYGALPPCSSTKDTVISVNYGLTDSTISVLGRDIFLDSAEGYQAYHYGLRFWNDSIRSYFSNGGLGGGINEIHEGYKISDTP
jgi:hypothetical protein